MLCAPLGHWTSSTSWPMTSMEPGSVSLATTAHSSVVPRTRVTSSTSTLWEGKCPHVHNLHDQVIKQVVLTLLFLIIPGLCHEVLGGTKVPQWRCCIWVLLRMVAPSAWHRLTPVLEPLPAALLQPGPTAVRLASGPTTRWGVWVVSINQSKGQKVGQHSRLTDRWHICQIWTFVKGAKVQWIDDQKVPSRTASGLVLITGRAMRSR